jgi:hypothetical protein
LFPGMEDLFPGTEGLFPGTDMVVFQASDVKAGISLQKAGFLILPVCLH